VVRLTLNHPRTRRTRESIVSRRIEGLIGELEGFYGKPLAPPRDPFMIFVWESCRPRRGKRGRGDRGAEAHSCAHAGRHGGPQARLEASVALAGPPRTASQGASHRRGSLPPRAESAGCDQWTGAGPR
jgi:hypothetical protein